MMEATFEQYHGHSAFRANRHGAVDAHGPSTHINGSNGYAKIADKMVSIISLYI